MGHLTIIPRVRAGYEMLGQPTKLRSAEMAIIISYPTRASRIIVLSKTPTKQYREFFPTLFVKTNDFQLVFNFEQTRTCSYHIWRAWYNGSYTMMAKPIRALELHYPMSQFLIIRNIPQNRSCIFSRTSSKYGKRRLVMKNSSRNWSQS